MLDKIYNTILDHTKNKTTVLNDSYVVLHLILYANAMQTVMRLFITLLY